MTDDYTPTTEDVEVYFALGLAEYSVGNEHTLSAAHDGFRRWLAAHDAALRAEWEAERLAEPSEVEWEYRYAELLSGTMYTYGPEHTEDMSFESFEEASGARIEDTDIVVRRRPAGPWVPVNENGDAE